MRTLSEECRLEIADEISAIFPRFGVPITFGWVDRSENRKMWEAFKLKPGDLAVAE